MKVPPKRRRNVVRILEVRHSASDLYVFPLASQQEEYGHITCAMFRQDVGNTARAYLSPALGKGNNDIPAVSHTNFGEKVHIADGPFPVPLFANGKRKPKNLFQKAHNHKISGKTIKLIHPVKISHCNYSASCKNVLPRTCIS